MLYYNMMFIILLKRINIFYGSQLLRHRHTKHWNPKFKKERREKVIECENSQELSEDEKRLRLKEKGIFPSKPWLEKPTYISCTGNIFESYVPPEGDGKFTTVTGGTKQNIEFFMKKTKSYRAYKKIKKYEEEFDINEFPEEAMKIYIMAHSALMRKDKSELIDNVTEKVFPEMLYDLENKTLIWKLVKLLEPAKIVHARCTSLFTESNIFAQVTTRFHTQQILALYDRFGRLIHGSKIIKKDVLDYVVFEKHLSNTYSKWRLHGKIIPTWMPPQKCVLKTFVKY
ncbi:large ribosomal subunit protein mL45 isoform X2 [Phymastichus coffea]|uniref:large ribosomal subunit protein mL45 isoform X2 n=1 Tax=Phymastichus coffea TaxID=108790 RepID=UPI00273BD89C|nr:large ribosomal subunit protein mL45 isoform X2 [Phymastichus coffea]